MKRLNSEIVGSFFWILFGVFFALGATKLQVGTIRHIGSGLFPMIMALVLIFFSVLNLVQGAMRSSRPIERIAWKKQVAIAMCVIFYGFLLDIIGFLVSTFILMLVFFALFFGIERKWGKVLVYSSVTALTAWLLFAVVLRVPFPSPHYINFFR
jgi:hypothetical protein